MTQENQFRFTCKDCDWKSNSSEAEADHRKATKIGMRSHIINDAGPGEDWDK